MVIADCGYGQKTKFHLLNQKNMNQNGLLKISLQKTVVGSNCPQLRWRHVKVETLRHANMASRGRSARHKEVRGSGAERKTTFLSPFPFRSLSTAILRSAKMPKGGNYWKKKVWRLSMSRLLLCNIIGPNSVEASIDAASHHCGATECQSAVIETHFPWHSMKS